MGDDEFFFKRCHGIIFISDDSTSISEAHREMIQFEKIYGCKNIVWLRKSFIFSAVSNLKTPIEEIYNNIV